MNGRALSRRMLSRRSSWLVMAIVLVAALGVGSQGRGGPPSRAERVLRVTTDIRCPTCQGLSAAVSDAPAARAIRDEVGRQVDDGRSDAAIKAFLVGRYGPGILLRPPARGVGLVVWVIPFLAVTAAVAALTSAFRRWRPGRAVTVSSADRDLVARALDEESP